MRGHTMTRIELVELIEDVVAALSCCERVADGGLAVIVADQVGKLKRVSDEIDRLGGAEAGGYVE